jgi:hypothetical protein
MKEHCNNCKKKVEFYTIEKHNKDKSSHIGIYCLECHKWIKWLSKTIVKESHLPITKAKSLF